MTQTPYALSPKKLRQWTRRFSSAVLAERCGMPRRQMANLISLLKSEETPPSISTRIMLTEALEILWGEFREDLYEETLKHQLKGDTNEQKT